MGGVSTRVAEIDGWSWWQARRLRYNLALGGAGMVAYALALSISLAFGEPLWGTAGEAIGQTLFLGTGFLALMGIANVCYLIGPIGEAWLKPRDLAGYRRNAFAMGFWGSVAVPFLVPLLNLSMQLG